MLLLAFWNFTPIVCTSEGFWERGLGSQGLGKFTVSLQKASHRTLGHKETLSADLGLVICSGMSQWEVLGPILCIVGGC